MQNIPFDTVVNYDDNIHYPQEFLKSLNPTNLPSRQLVIQIGALIILLRNLGPPKLCNRTRLQVIGFKNNTMKTKMLAGTDVGEHAVILRISMIPTDLPFQFKRRQYPVKICSVKTINKAQGQSFKCVDID